MQSDKDQGTHQPKCIQDASCAICKRKILDSKESVKELRDWRSHKRPDRNQLKSMSCLLRTPSTNPNKWLQIVNNKNDNRKKTVTDEHKRS